MSDLRRDVDSLKATEKHLRVHTLSSPPVTTIPRKCGSLRGRLDKKSYMIVTLGPGNLCYSCT